jgi:sugar lactone lactonase YvrE
VLAIAKDGSLRELPHGEGRPFALASDPDGTPWMLSYDPAEGKIALVALRPDGPEPRADWSAHLDPTGCTLHIGPDGTAYACFPEGPKLEAIAKDGTATILAGTGAPAGAPSGTPGRVTTGPDGTLYLVDGTSSRVFARSPAGSWRPYAGADGVLSGTTDFTALAINGPVGLAFDEQDRLIFAQGAGFSIERFDGTRIERLAGRARGNGGDGGPATEALLSGPTALAWKDGVTWFIDGRSGLLRRIAADGTITTVGGTVSGRDVSERPVLKAGQRLASNQVSLTKVNGLAIGPDGLPYLSMSSSGQIWRLATDGNFELVAGVGSEQGLTSGLLAGLGQGPAEGPAKEALLAVPTGLGFDRKGDLYVAEAAGFRVRRLSGVTGDAPVIHAFAGMAVADTLAVIDAEPGAYNGREAAAFPLPLPGPVVCDADGNVFIGVVGGGGLDALPPSFADQLAQLLEGRRARGAFIVRIDAGGHATVLAGPGGRYFPDDQAEDALMQPGNLAIDGQGRLAIADYGANLLRILPAGTAGKKL